jgi:hypothetical protein
VRPPCTVFITSDGGSGPTRSANHDGRVQTPCISNGALDAYSQHINHLYEQDDDRCPRQAFLEDLRADIQKWIQVGEQVLVMLDTIEDIHNGAVQQMFSEMGMREVLLGCNSDLSEASRYSHNFQDTPIDGIFATPSINLQAGRYLAFGEGPGVDHRALWVNLSYQAAFGHSTPVMEQSKAQRHFLQAQYTYPERANTLHTKTY